MEMVASLGCEFQEVVAQWVESDNSDPILQIMENNEIYWKMTTVMTVNRRALLKILTK